MSRRRSARHALELAAVVAATLGCSPGPRTRPPAQTVGCAAGTCTAPAATRGACPEDMVLIGGAFCIDRYEASMDDVHTGLPFSPYYPPTFDELRRAITGQKWALAAVGKEKLRPEVPLLPAWERSPDARARAVSRRGRTPQGYVSKLSATATCVASGKRLCTLDEWSTACRGEQKTPFPYGSKYQSGACNVRSRHHPAAILYGDASMGHWDPRLNHLEVDGAPLLKPTGGTPTCRSPWGSDGVYDMVGNIDEWVLDGKGTFAGGFYARETVRGCDARVVEHGPTYFDYSTGVRCCTDAAL